LHQKAKDNEAALDAYEQAIQASPEDANTHFMRANFLEKQGRSDQALQAYQWSASLEPESAYYQFIVGRELLEAGQHQTGIGHLERALQLDNSLRMHNDVKKLYGKHLLPEETIASYERIVAVNPNDPIAIDTLLDQFVTTGQCEAALALAEPDTDPEVLSDNPPTVNNYLNLAEIAKVCQEKTLAADAYAEVIQLASRNPIGYLELGLLRLEEGVFQEAHELFITAATLDNTAGTYKRVKQAYLNQQNLSESITLLRDLLEQAAPPVLHPYEDLTALYTTIGQNNQAVPILQLAATAMPTDHELNFRLAQTLYDAGQIAPSVEYYRQAIAQQPEERLYQLHLGRALFTNGDLEEGAEVLKTVLQNSPNQETYEFIRDLYYNHLTWPDPQPYIEEIALIHWPQADLAYSKLAQWYINYGYPDAAIDSYQKAIEIVPTMPNYRIEMGRLYFQQGNVEVAEPIFVQALMTDTSNESFQAIQKLYFNQWGGNEALDRLTALLEQARPSVKEIYVNHVEQSRRLGLSGQALPVWQLAADVLPNDADLQVRLAREFERVGEIDDAISTYRQVVEQEPDQTEYRLALGDLLLRADQPDEGSEILKNALLRNPTGSAYTFVRDVYHKYVSLQSAEDNEATDEAFLYQEEIARILWPNPAQAFQRLAQWYLDSGQSAQAVLAYERMIEIAPNDPASYLALGKLRFDLGETEVAVELFTQAITRDSNKGTYRAVQRFYLERLSMEESLDRLQQNLAEAQPTIKQPYIDLINQYKRQEMNEEIIPVLQLALQAFGLDILPEDADLYYLLAEALYAQDEVDAAIGAYRRAATMQPQNHEWQLNYGRALLAGGHLDDGLRTLKGVLARTSSLQTYRFIRDNLHELIEWPESQAMQEEITQIYWGQIKKTTPASAYKQLAAWYQEQGQIEGAIATYQNATDLLSDDPTSYLELGLLQFEAGDIAASQTQFQQAVALDTTPKTYQAIQNLYTSKLAPSRAAFSLLYLLEQAQPKTLHAYQILIDFYEDIGDTSQKASILQLAVEAMPENDEAIASLADTFYESSEVEESIPLYRRAVTLRPENPTYGLRLGRSLLNTDEVDTAIAAIEQALRQEPTQRNYEFARDLYQESLPTEQPYALQERLALIQWPLPSDAYSNLARWYQDQGEITAAVSAYEDAIAADDTLASLYVDLGRLQFEQGQQKIAETLFVKAIAMDQSPISSRSIWQFYANNLEPDRALASQLQLLAEAKPLHIQPYDDLIGHYQSVGLTSPETTILQIAVSVMPEESQTHFKLAESLYQAALYEEAQVSYRQAVTLQPSNHQYRLGLGRSLLAAEQVDEGVDILQSVLRQMPTKQIYTQVRDTYQETLPWPASEAHQLRAALVRWPNFRQAYQNLAVWYAGIAQPDAAISTYQQILEIEQENQDAHEQLNTLYLAQDKCDEASYHGLQFARVADDANSYQSLAKTYAQCGPQEAVAISYEYSMARMAEAEISRKKPRNVVDVAFRRYGSELADEEIAKLLNNAFLEEDFDQSAPYNQLGWYWETIEQPANALPLYQKAVEIEPTNGNNHFTLGRLYHELGDVGQALPEYQRALTLSGIKTQSAYLRYGKALVETGRYDQGAEMLAKGFGAPVNATP